MPDPRILILTADTGGGHRSVSESLAEAFQEAGQGGVVIVYAFRYLPGPLTQIPKLYLPTINYASVFWRVMYYSLNRQLPGDFLMTKIIYALSARALRRIYREHQPALVVSTHPLFQYGAARVLQGQYPGTPFATMVTDFASAHRWWFTPLTDLCLLPSEELRSVALANRIPPERIHVIGLPVHRAFSLNRYLTRQEARAALGVSECPTLLIVGGGEGMGALGEMAQAVDESLPSMQKLIVAGRNRNLQRQLQARHWAGPTHVYGFVRNMPQLMRAADVIVTKAGPSTLS